MIRQFIDAADLKGIDYVPASKLAEFSQTLNNILMDKIAYGDEKAWDLFLDQQDAFRVKRVVDRGSTKTTTKEEPKENSFLHKTRTQTPEKRTHS